MTLHLTLGVDPGQGGAIAVLADGEFDRFIDMPLCLRASGGKEVDVPALQAQLRGLKHEHRGAYILAVTELVAGHRGQGGSSSFAFGRADGQLDATIKCVGIPILQVHPATWKAFMQLRGKDKEASRRLAQARHPKAKPHLTLKKHEGRAEALLIATWALLTEQVGSAAA